MRYLSEKNLPDIALDIVDEAGSEFGVKEEFAARSVTTLTQQIDELGKLLTACDGKSPDKEAAAFDQMYAAYDVFSRELERLHDFWGHRLPTETGGTA